MKFSMKIFLSFAALTLVQASTGGPESAGATPKDKAGAEETRKLQEDPRYAYNGDAPKPGYSAPEKPYYPPATDYAPEKPYYPAATEKPYYTPEYPEYETPKKKGRKPAKRSPPKSYGGGDGCAELYCDALFKKANAGTYTTYGSYYPKKFTRHDCQWIPSGSDETFGGCAELSMDQYEACSCFWSYEVKCDTNVLAPPHSKVAADELEIALAEDVEYCIINGKCCSDYYGAGYSYGNSYSKCPYDSCFSQGIYDCFCARPQ